MRCTSDRPVRASGWGSRTLAVALTALVASCGGSGDTSAPVTDPEIGASSSTPEATSTPAAIGVSTPPDPSSLRYPQRLPSDAVAFVNDLSLPAPVVSVSVGAPGPEPQQGTRQARFVLMVGAEVSATGMIAELARAWDPSEFGGDQVDIGIDGAVFADDDEGAIAYPVDGAVRLVASNNFVQFGTADPAVTAEELATVARAVGASDNWNTAELENQGIHIFDELVSSAQAPGTPRKVSVEHGPTMSVVLYRFDQPLSEPRFIAFAANLIVVSGSELPGDVELGDTAITLAEGYVELVSPVDVAVVAFTSESIEALLDIASADELDVAFDGTVNAPPRPNP